MGSDKDVLKNSIELLYQQSIFYTSKLKYIEDRIKAIWDFDPNGIAISDELTELQSRFEEIYSSKLKSIEKIMEILAGQGQFGDYEIGHFMERQKQTLENLSSLQTNVVSLKEDLKRKNFFGFLVEGITGFFQTITKVVNRVGKLAFDTLKTLRIGGSGNTPLLPPPF